jgi:hypothetical protein
LKKRAARRPRSFLSLLTHVGKRRDRLKPERHGLSSFSLAASSAASWRVATDHRPHWQRSVPPPFSSCHTARQVPMRNGLARSEQRDSAVTP